MYKKEWGYRIFFVILTLYFFFISIKLMGGAFKLFGSEFAETLFNYTTNPFVGLFIGVLATSLVQSSSVTTSIIVGLTASGALSVGSAVPIIMGANIGTSVTNTIVSLAHIKNKQEFKQAFEVATVHDFFNIIIVLILFPIELYFGLLEKSATFLTSFFLGSNINTTFSSPLDFIVSPVAHSIQDFLGNNPLFILIVSFFILYFSLALFSKLMRPIAHSEFKYYVNKHIFSRPLRCFGFGLILTVFVQSSSITTSLVVPLAGVGIITLETIFPYILGANIGTTFTAILASITIGSPAGVIVALEHFLFNTLGSIIIYPIKKVPIAMSYYLSNLCLKSRLYAFFYIISTFYAIPLFIIFEFH